MHQLESWDCSDAYTTRFMALLYLPWVFKPVFGLITDFVPLAGFRRKSYLFLSSTVAVRGFYNSIPSGFQKRRRDLVVYLLIVADDGRSLRRCG